MTCEDLKNGDWLERYAAGTLSDEGSASVERHFFACDACLAEAQALVLAREALAEEPAAGSTLRPVWRPWLAAAAMLAVSALAASAVVWTVKSLDREPASTAAYLPPQTVSMPEAAGPQAGGTEAGQAKPTQATRTERPAAATKPVATGEAAAGPTVSRRPLPGGFEAPAFFALTMRGQAAPDDPLQDARTAYGQGDFPTAARLLAARQRAGTATAEVAFYLGVSLLKSGDVDAGLAALGDAAASGQAPFAVEAHYYAARGHLSAGREADARAALDRYIALQGDLEREALTLRRQLGAPGR
jgi:hypothetical protein